MSPIEAPEEYLREAEMRARKFSGAYTGTSGTLAADVIRLIGMVRSFPRVAAAERALVAELDAVKPRLRLIGLSGPAGAGKDLVASMIPHSRRVAFADPLYAGLAAMLGCEESTLRDRRTKEQPTSLGVSPRRLLQTLGTEWGRRLVHDEIWLRIAKRRWARAWEDGVHAVVVPDVRFENEAEAIRAAGGEIWLVHRPSAAPVEAHASEAGLPLRLVDRLLLNGSTVTELRYRVESTLALTAAAG